MSTGDRVNRDIFLQRDEVVLYLDRILYSEQIGCNSIGSAIASKRTEHGWSREDLSEKSNVSVNEIEAQEESRVCLDSLRFFGVCSVLDVSVPAVTYPELDSKESIRRALEAARPHLKEEDWCRRIGTEIQIIRDFRSMGAESLAKLAGVSHEGLEKQEAGQGCLQIPELVRVCKSLGTTLPSLLYRAARLVPEDPKERRDLINFLLRRD